MSSNRRGDMVLNAVAGRRASNSGWVRGNCPFCEMKTDKPDRKQCLGLHVATGKWHCFRCGSGGIITDLPDDITDLKPETPEDKETRRPVEPPEGFRPIYDGDWLTALMCAAPLDYLRGRGLSDELGKEAGIGAVFEGKLRGRVVVPIYDLDGGTWLGWSARAWYAGAFRKYLYPSGMMRAELIYNHKALHVATDKPVYVVEGVFDALALWPDAVAVLGKPSSFQVDALEIAKRPVVVCFDGDAWREGDALSRKLRFLGQRAGFIRLGPGIDPDEMDRAELDKLAFESLEG
jgi:hypothetical protein